MPLVFAATLPELFPAIALLLLAWAALIILRKPLVDLLSQLPVIGGNVARAVGDGIGAIVGWALGWATTALYALVQLVWLPARQLNAWLSAGVTMLEAAASFLAALPAAISRVYSWAEPRLAALTSAAAALALRVAHLPAEAAATARAVAASLVAAAVALLRGELATAKAETGAAISATAAAAAAEVAAVHSILEAERAKDAAATAAAVTAVRVGLDGQVQDVAGQVAHVGQLVAPLVAAGLIGRTLALERTLTQTLDECVNPTCSALGPSLGMFQAFSTLATLGIVGAAVGEAIAHPAEAAAATAAAVGDVESVARDLLGAFAGVSI